MADLLSILSQAASSLGAHRTAAATASHNLENANTPGYARQSAILETVSPAEAVPGVYIGRGVTVTTVTQTRDRFLEAQIPNALASSAQADAESQALSSLHALDPDLSNGIGSALSGYFSALRALSQNPGSDVLRQGLVDSSRGLVLAFKRTTMAISDARTGLDQEAAGLVTQVNTLTQQMAQLNREIRATRAAGAEPNDLLDARQRLQDQISELTGARPVPDGAGDVSMVLENGIALVSVDRAATLTTAPDPTNGGHLGVQAMLANGTGHVAISSAGGQLGGVIDARDGALKNAAGSLDTLAFDFATATNAVHRAGYALDGSIGHNLFSVGTSASGAASTLDVDADVAANPGLIACAQSPASVPGDPSNAFALIEVESESLSTGLTPEGTLGRIVSDFGTAAQRAGAKAQQEQAIKNNLQQMRESASGVSIDEEMVEMTRAQRAYEAVSRIVSVTDTMLETLMKLGT